jgi:hypothetical protein
MLAFALGWFRAWSRDWRSAILAAAFLAMALGLAYLRTRRNLAKLLRPVPDAIASEPRIAQTPTAGGPAESGSIPRELHSLLSMATPRAVRMSRRGKVSTAVILAIDLIFECIVLAQLLPLRGWLHAPAGAPPKLWFLAVAAVFFALLPLVLWRGCVRERDLLANGEVAIAGITSAVAGKTNYIQFEFQDATGQTHRKNAADYTRRFFQGMSVAVFYDRSNPNRQVASCSSFYELLPPGA